MPKEIEILMPKPQECEAVPVLYELVPGYYMHMPWTPLYYTDGANVYALPFPFGSNNQLGLKQFVGDILKSAWVPVELPEFVRTCCIPGVTDTIYRISLPKVDYDIARLIGGFEHLNNVLRIPGNFIAEPLPAIASAKVDTKTT